ncbi:vacuolar iron transporter 4-like [Pyrus ussuriensis x Pyrus communis]|uniref:Vacuolar iron transporter 4-like n=1 Tax=Pyrus ussuriensis x Pyrus communis TaxID=2448454 RepID=A0A5N5FK49_9ROSA|nr:vacuolar iron transporter 4-like [Pyrus ussuriensis x Pyrus communis]
MTYKFGDAAEGQGVGPETAGLELASPCADVNQFGAGRTAEGGGKEAENEGRWGFDGGWRWGGGWVGVLYYEEHFWGET